MAGKAPGGRRRCCRRRRRRCCCCCCTRERLCGPQTHPALLPPLLPSPRAGFNPGSTLGIIGYANLAAQVAVNTTIAAAAGTIFTMGIVMIHQYWTTGMVVYDLILAGNGALAGLVAITGGCGFMPTWAPLITGAIGGGVYYLTSQINLRVLKVGGWAVVAPFPEVLAGKGGSSSDV